MDEHTQKLHSALDKLFWSVGAVLMFLFFGWGFTTYFNISLITSPLIKLIISTTFGILVGMFMSSVYLEKIELEQRTKHPYLAQFFGLKSSWEINNDNVR